VLFLLKTRRPELTGPVASARIFFTACDGVRCQRVCRPQDVLTLVVKPKRIKHPLAIFQGHITCGAERVAFAEEISLTFDYATPAELAIGNNGQAPGAPTPGADNTPPRAEASTPPRAS
jgi:3-hydroxyacyl-[acyl-carrier-protein] dehydratase